MEFATWIKKTRHKVRKKQAGYTESDWKQDRARKPLIFYLIRDRRFNEQYRDQRKLLERGDVVWASIIQANELLFQPNGPMASLPAALMYSLDKSYDDDPELLQAQAHSMFDLKGRKGCTREMQKFADKLENELVADIKLPIPVGFTDGVPCYYGTLIIPRSHLPGGCLQNGIFPILVNPEETDAIMVLPRRFWDAEFRRVWDVERQSLVDS